MLFSNDSSEFVTSFGGGVNRILEDEWRPSLGSTPVEFPTGGGGGCYYDFFYSLFSIIAEGIDFF